MRFISKTFTVLVFTLLLTLSLMAQDYYSRNNQLDINNASFEEILKLPVSTDLARKLYEHVLYKGYFNSIYEIREIDGVDQQLLNKLKPLLRIEPFKPKTGWEEKVEEIYYQLDRWSANEGINDIFIDLWIDKALDPLNVNSIRYDELINLQNVSPMDAAAVVRYRRDIGEIRSARDLRGVPGLSYYGYRNASRFLDYKAPAASETQGLHGHFTMRMDDTPFFSDEEAAATEVGVTALESQYDAGGNFLPNMYYKMRFSYNRDYKFGFTYTRNLGEPDLYYNGGSFRIPKGKFYFGLENRKFGDVSLRKLYVGNYSLSFGQGVVMENTDFFTPRKSGFGFRKRFSGISGDNSRTRSFALKGMAAELQFQDFTGIFFGSFTSRDAILNSQISDSSRGRGFNQLIVLDQRFAFAPDDPRRLPSDLNLSWRNSVREMTYGMHLQYDILPGTYVGASYYESAYDRPIEPEISEIVAPENMGRLVTADNEIRAAYGFDVSQGTNPFWSDAVSFRRVYGLDFQAVYENFSLQGEWGELDKGGNVFTPGDDPKAVVLSAYAQFSNLNILALYRNYDLGYDNPYQRSFSNYHRFKGTIYEDYYYLQSALYGQLYANSAQPQAEEGFYLNSRYQINRNLVTIVEYDNWARKADQARQYRLVGTLDYRPVFPLRIQLRQKWQARDEQNSLTLRYFKNLEFRGRATMRLSGFDNFGLLYVSAKTLVHPRPRVFGDIVLDGEAIGATFTHNFNRNLKLSGMLAYYEGFFWNFEDTQFVVLDSQRGALRSWWSLYARLDNHFSARLKLSVDHQKPMTNISYNSVRDPIAGQSNATDYLRDSNNYFYVEFNYNF